MTAADRIPQPLTDELLAEIDGRSAPLYEYVELPDEAGIVVGQDVPAPLAHRPTPPPTDELLAEIDGRSAHLYEYVELPDEADIVVGQDVPALLAEVQRLKGELAKYVGAEPTIAEEMAHLSSCLDAVHALCDEAGAKGITSGGTFTVDAVRDAADGIRPDNPKDRRRRIYID